jgi:Ca-activated chloride channel family protein
MSWYQTLSWLEIIFGTAFLLLYAGYIYRVKRLAMYFKQAANEIWIKFAIRSLYFLLLLVAILGPSFGDMKKEIRTTGKDIMLLVDLSSSMNTRDLAPSRLERIKYELNELIPAFNADRMGLIIFSSNAYLQCPLTFDQSALLLYTRLLTTKLVPEAAANFLPPLELAYEKFGGRQPSPAETNKAQVVLLVSDGEDFSPDVRPVLQRLARNNIRVFTVGLGSEEGGPIPVGKSYKLDKNGTRVTSRLHADRLKEIAAKTGGQYFEINNQENQSSQLVRLINNIEGEKRESRTIDITANKYIYPLLAALVLIALDILLTVTVIKL